MSNIEIRLISEDEYTKVNDVYNQAYGNKRPYTFFEWEFIKGPAGKAIYVIAVDTDLNKIVGTQSAIPLYFITPTGNKILTAKSEDTLVDPAYRGMKLFDKMYDALFAECKRAGIKCIWGFTYALKPFQKVGFDVPFSQSQGVYVVDISKAYSLLKSLNPANRVKDKVKILLLCIFSKAKSILSPLAISQEFNIELKIVADKSELLANGICKNEYYVINQDADYVKWRITDNPYRNQYAEINVYDRHKRLLVNITINLRENGVAYIEQILPTADSSQAAIHAGISAAIQKLKDIGAALIRFWGFDFNEAMIKQVELLKANGFIFINRGTGFVWYDYAKGTVDSIDPKRLFLNRIYTQGNN